MFVSFFPSPRLFFWSAAIWSLVAIAVWYLGGSEAGSLIGLHNPPADAPPVIGVSEFWSASFIWFYIYFAIFASVFYTFWRYFAPHPWQIWSVLGTALIMFATYFQVQVGVAINKWYGPFYDLLQAALAKTRPVSASEFYAELLTFAGIAFVAVIAYSITRFFVNHYIFRWRQAMNDYYISNWQVLRKIEGASQRVQEDTMRFAKSMEFHGANIVDSVMTLIAFLPILLAQSKAITELPIIGEVPYALVWAAIFWSIGGTVFLFVLGRLLPGLEFRNQRVEAAYRKELVYGEDDASRAQPMTLNELFVFVRKNYFRLYFNYFYFNIGWRSFLQADNIFPYLILVPTLVAGKLTLGPFQQILNAFGQVRDSFLYLVNQWPYIIELISIYKRLRAFEATIHGDPLAPIDLETATPAESKA